MKLTVLTFNIHHGKGLDQQVNLERIAGIIQASKADIIGLNEVDCHFSSRSSYENQAKRLGELTQMDYEFGASVIYPSMDKSINDRQYGNAILSRYPILHQETHVLQPKWMKGEKRSVLEATIQVNHLLIDTFVSHLSLNPWFSRRQCAFMVQRAKRSEINGKKILILGDWNMRPHSKNWNILTSSFKDVWYEHHHKNDAGILGNLVYWINHWTLRSHGSTFPSHSPKLRLDYIFASQCFHVEQAEVFTVDQTASDHLPVRVCLSLNENGLD